MKNKVKSPLFITIASLLVGFVIIGSVFALVIANANSSEAGCERPGETHNISITDDVASPRNTYATKCDKVVITNSDAVTRKIGFGDHDNHQAFGGVDEKVLHKGQSFTLLLTETGTGNFHDHYNYDVEGTIVVTE